MPACDVCNACQTLPATSFKHVLNLQPLVWLAFFWHVLRAAVMDNTQDFVPPERLAGATVFQAISLCSGAAVMAVLCSTGLICTHTCVWGVYSA